MSNPYRDRLLGIGIISRRSGSTVREGRQHPETGVPWKATTDEAGTTTTEHAKGDRVDATVRPATVRAVRVRRTNDRQ
ncbi:hypothetical protein AMIS_20860 [Actinoplanes missouriensis 431]|uniref:Uncharacterized protein n=1 Tax=Actinoplanes missouriensis (strain ATCC 14538 / DSM 43046 / CBS 188.64 / JCM 3121 / NBRC 102363 / NCIMB 12654 / NRRL B-3342 / UNCC 431) TaxID=512565 RepID=I0H2R9_ACTM4|nr:hypothetical protein [Actinoplanes missouriensis]BAL87306.1 hypothetical protein AMIS_20860 [Actinoplanes missouriensis 431]